MIYLLFLLLACGQTATDAPADAPQGMPSTEVHDRTPKTKPVAEVDDSCTFVFTGDDATALYQFAATLPAEGDCTFSDIDAKGSKVSVVYKTAAGAKVPVQLEPMSCVKEPIMGAIVHDPYVLTAPANAQKQCPKALKSLAKAVEAGELPPPSER